MTWFAVFTILLLAIAATIVFSVIAFFCGYKRCAKDWGNLDELVKERASKECDRLLKQEIGKTIAGVNDGKRYNWKIHYDNDGEDKCNVMRFGVDNKLSDIVNLINRRAIEWGCDITCIEVKRVDVDNV